MSQQIARSTVANKTRLKVLAARQELLDDIFESTRTKLDKEGLGTKDKGKYEKVLQGLVLEGFYAMSEPEVKVRARKADADVVKKAIKGAEGEYKKELGKEVKGILDESSTVPDDSAGGVIMIGGGGKIEIDNTFEARLKLLEDNSLPAIRQTLFGSNPNRKFFD